MLVMWSALVDWPFRVACWAGSAELTKNEAQRHAVLAFRNATEKLRPLHSCAEVFFDVRESLAERIQLLGDTLDFSMGAAVDIKIKLAAQSVLFVLPVLAHHDDGGLDSCDHGKEEVEKNVGIRVPTPHAQQQIHCDGESPSRWQT